MASNGSDSGGRRPRIGVTTYLQNARHGVWDHEAAVLPRSYVDVVARVGGTPLLLPPVALRPLVAARKTPAARLGVLVQAWIQVRAWVWARVPV